MNDRPLRDVIGDAWSALLASTKLGLFNRRGQLVRLMSGEWGLEAALESPDTVNGRLYRAADWFQRTRGGLYHRSPPAPVARDMLVNPHPGVPRLEAIASVPFFLPDGELIVRPGLHPGSGIYLAPVGLDGLPEVPAAPSREQVARARALILEEVLGDFTFVAEADRAHAVAAMLLPHVRSLIDGPTPGHLYEAPTPGSGKGLLAESTSLIATGRIAPTCSLPRDEDEIRRTLTAELSKGRPLIWLDNLDSSQRRIHSATVAAILTAPVWSDRQVRTSNKIDLPNRALWLLTGNNPQLSMELARRCVRIRLDPGIDQPWLRQGSEFRHPSLLAWVGANRPQLVHALLTLVAAWLAEGRPSFDRVTFGSFESWAAVVGGILNVAGIPGFLGNLTDLYREADVEGQEWREFVGAWREVHKNRPATPAELCSLCVSRDLMENVRGAGSPQSQITKLGLALRGARDRVFGRFRICIAADKGRHKGRAYALAVVEAAALGANSERGDPAQGPPKGPQADSAEDSAESTGLGDVGDVSGGSGEGIHRTNGGGAERRRDALPVEPGPYVPQVPEVPTAPAEPK